MGLDETQIKFLEDFILKRKIRRLGTERDPPRGQDPETAGPVDPDDIHRVAAAAARLTTPEGALSHDVAALAAHRHFRRPDLVELIRRRRRETGRKDRLCSCPCQAEPAPFPRWRRCGLVLVRRLFYRPFLRQTPPLG